MAEYIYIIRRERITPVGKEDATITSFQALPVGWCDYYFVPSSPPSGKGLETT
jgi:hypothetical protein